MSLEARILLISLTPGIYSIGLLRVSVAAIVVVVVVVDGLLP